MAVSTRPRVSQRHDGQIVHHPWPQRSISSTKQRAANKGIRFAFLVVGCRRHPIAWWQDTSVEQSPLAWISQGTRCGTKASKTPVGSPQFVQHTVDMRLEEEKKLWETIIWVPDLQSAWEILLQCEGPVATMFCERCPQSIHTHYAAEHDEGMLKVMSTLLGGIPGGDQEKEDALRLATLPMRMGGLGLRSPARVAPAAFWAWASCALQRLVCIGRGSWGALQMGARPPPAHDTEPGNGPTVGNTRLPKSVVFAQSCLAHQAHLRSHSGSGCSHLLHGCPTRPEFKIDRVLFHVLFWNV